ncbi:MAG TPA: regulatory iron-sulfur-containing complex subunit RicT [Actinomycetes bacterium]
MVMAVSFERHGRLYYLDPGAYQPHVGDLVLYPTSRGAEVAECVWAPSYVADEIGGLPVCAGLATDDDVERNGANRRQRARILMAARRLTRVNELPLKIGAVDWDGEGDVATIYFTAPMRVDFRRLVRDLARTLACRIELRQLSARDEARVLGGIGSCGRDTCCSTFLKDFEPVSIRMAKDQDLPANPLRISGACGRLMCCLKYEHPLYQEFRATTPEVGEFVDTDEGPAQVVGYNVPGEQVYVRGPDGRRKVCAKASVCGSRQSYEASRESLEETEPAG